MPERRIGVDVGGTKICAAVVGPDGQIICGPVVRPTERQRPPDEIVAAIVATVRSLTDAGGGEA